MSRRRGAGIVPAIGWSLPVFVLATGLSTARADEIGDLRANQELLQRRIDQLAQVPPPAPPPGGPGGPVLAGSFPRSFVIPGTDSSRSPPFARLEGKSPALQRGSSSWKNFPRCQRRGARASRKPVHARSRRTLPQARQNANRPRSGPTGGPYHRLSRR